MHLRHDERGVTLPEVLVAITILAIIIIPLGDALIGFIRNTDATSRRMIESQDMQLATAYFARDIQNLGVRDWSSPTLALRPSIDNTSYPSYACGNGTSVIRLAWDDPTSVSDAYTTIRVTYQVRDVGGEHQLRRLLCRGSATVDSEVVVVHNLVGNPNRVCSIPTVCNTANVPQRVTLTMTIKHPANTAPISLTLIGQRRQT
jgi:prepilin-type N-terminal cleavage/methylation domain-containing protein